MKKLVIKLLGKDLFCILFHTKYGVDDKWRCDKCDLLFDKKFSDKYTGPKWYEYEEFLIKNKK